MLGVGLSINKLKPATKKETPYQQWLSFKQSPELTENYPFQCVFHNASYTAIVLMNYPCVFTPGGEYYLKGTYKIYKYTSEEWVYFSGNTYAEYNYWGTYVGIDECNKDVYGDTNLSFVSKTKTT